MISIIVLIQPQVLLADHILQKRDSFVRCNHIRDVVLITKKQKDFDFTSCLKNSTYNNYAEIIIHYGLSNLTPTDSPTSFLL